MPRPLTLTGLSIALLLCVPLMATATAVPVSGSPHIQIAIIDQAPIVDPGLGITYRIDDEEIGISYMVPEAWNVTSIKKEMRISPTIHIPNDLLRQSLAGIIVVEAKTLSVPLTAQQMHTMFLSDYTLQPEASFDYYAPNFDLRGSGAVFVGGVEGRTFDFTSRVSSRPAISRVIYIPLDRTLYTFRTTATGKNADDAAYGFEQFSENFEWFISNVEFIGHERETSEVIPEESAPEEPEEEPEQSATTVQPFTDVDASQTQGKTIAWMRDHNIASGYPDGTFKPERTINRAEFTKIIVGAVYERAKINECPALSSVSPFHDVSTGDWFLPYTCTARRFGIMNGYPDGSFGPARDINSAEAAKIVAGAFGLSIEKSTSGPWFQPYMDALDTLGALPASAQDPAHLLTRGEMAEIVYRVMAQ
ncbi:MAG: S-layer homology domain-containing protein [Candidatus Peregrinibacteria bacterium]